MGVAAHRVMPKRRTGRARFRTSWSDWCEETKEEKSRSAQPAQPNGSPESVVEKVVGQLVGAEAT